MNKYTNKKESPITGFQLFDNSKLTRVVDKITITTGSQFNFPAAFYSVNKLEGTRSARLYYNNETRQIAISFSNVDDEKGFKFVLSNDGKYGGYIAAKSFITLNKIDLNKYTGRYNYKKMSDDSTTYYIIDLKDKDNKDKMEGKMA